MRMDRIVFKIECKPLTPIRKRQVSLQDAPRIGRPLRIVLVAGGAYLFFLGTDGSAPSEMAGVAVFFSVFGVAAVLMAIFIQLIVNMFFFAKATRKNSFPAEATVGEGGLYINTKSAEKHIPFSQIGRIEEQEDYFKIPIRGENPGEVFLFKEDFEKGDPEGFNDYFRSK